MLKFYTENMSDSSDIYSSTTQSSVDEDAFIDRFLDSSNPQRLKEKSYCNRFTVSTELINGDHFLALDIDGEDAGIAAVASLERRSLKYSVIKSSEQNQWFIVDFVGSWNDVYRLLRRIPGVDKQFVKMSKKRKRINLRAVPQSSFFPVIVDRSSAVREINNWLTSYSKFMGDLENDMLDYEIQTALDNGSIEQYLSDPKTNA